MKSAVKSSLVTTLAVILLLFAILPGCDTTPTTGPPPTDSELTIWLGSYSSTEDDDSGAFMTGL